jgi:hypothetical protein
MPSKSFNLKAAVAVTVAVLSVAGVAAAATTGRSTGPAEQAAAQAALAPRGTPTQAHGGGAAARDATGPASDSSTTGKSHAGPVGPDVTGPAKDGLCQAWQSGQGGSNGGRLDSTAFQALARAAGGADKVDAFCRTAGTNEPAANGQGQGSRPDDVTQPRSGDHGNGQGGPPTTSG